MEKAVCEEKESREGKGYRKASPSASWSYWPSSCPAAGGSTAITGPLGT